MIAQWGRSRLPHGVIRVILTVRRSLPVYPDKRTISEPVGTSHLCQMRISGTSEHKGARTPRSAQPYGLPMGVVPPAKLRAVSGR
jgi:hypothetical protein